MILEARVFKNGKEWLAECPDLDALTQGKSKGQATAMLKDWVRSMLNDPQYKVGVEAGDDGRLLLKIEPSAKFFALLLQRTREKHHMSVRAVAELLGFKSHNSYAQYERGKTEPSVSQFEKFLRVASRGKGVNLKFG